MWPTRRAVRSRRPPSGLERSEPHKARPRSDRPHSISSGVRDSPLWPRHRPTYDLSRLQDPDRTAGGGRRRASFGSAELTWPTQSIAEATGNLAPRGSGLCGVRSGAGPSSDACMTKGRRSFAPWPCASRSLRWAARPAPRRAPGTSRRAPGFSSRTTPIRAARIISTATAHSRRRRPTSRTRGSPISNTASPTG